MDKRHLATPLAAGRAVFLMLWLLALGCTAPEAIATEPSNEAANRIHFSITSGRDVANDWVTAVVGTTAEDADAAGAADTVNRTMAWALEKVRAEASVKSKSGGYNTYPVHDKGRIRRWRAHQDLIIESADVDAVTKLVGVLQARVQLQSFQFSVARKTREAVEGELVSEALAAFKARAELIRQGIAARSYAIDDLHLDTHGGGGPRPMRMRAMAAEAAPAPPAVEGGSSRVQVTARGSIILE
ncbi:MAG: SIMPL domain-containing protein [Myxococcota bacterium]|jgi:predicted secreted protein|nr:SIMPL domain-containing protein [Myxococcota bacterium]